MWEALAPDDWPERASASPVELMLAWVGQRYTRLRHECVFHLLGALAAAQDPDRAHAVASEHAAWVNRAIQPPGQPPFLYDLKMKLGDVESAAGRHEAAAREYDRAAAFYARATIAAPADFERLAYARFNAANELARSGRLDEATTSFRAVRSAFQELSDVDAVLRVDHSLLFARWQFGGHEGIDPDLNELTDRYQVLLADSADRDPMTPVRRENLAQAQRLLLSVVAARVADSREDAALVVRVIDELREREPARRKDIDGERAPFLPTVSDVLLRRLSRLPDTCVLLAEGGVDCVVLVAIGRPAGAAELTTRVALAGAEMLSCVETLIGAARDTGDALIAESLPLRSPASDRLRATAQRLWTELPPDVRQLIESCTTVFYSPSIRTGLDELPIELVHTGDDWLGLTHRVVRAPSPAHLAHILAPNAVPRALQPSAYVLRAEDPAELGELLNADADAARTKRVLAAVLGLAATLQDAPTAEEALAQLDAGHRVVHYVGHGAAGELGEALFLGHDESIDTRALAGLAPQRTPFVYLSCCLAGRARYLQGGDEVGFGVELLERGAPGVMAATYAVPDRACSDLAVAFYRECGSHQAGEALRRARAALDASGVHPVAWSAFSLQGDPNWSVGDTRSGTPDSREVALDALAHLGRFAASRSDQDREAALAALAVESATDGPTTAIAEWIATAFTPAGLPDPERERICRALSDHDRCAAATLRALLSLERLAADGEMYHADELGLGVTLALRLHDDFLLAAFAAEQAANPLGKLRLEETLALLRAGGTAASGLAAFDSRFASGAQAIADSLVALERMTLVDASDALDVGVIAAREQRAAQTVTAATDRDWTDWMLRMIASDEPQAGWDFRAWIRGQRERGPWNGRLDALERVLEEFYGPGAVPAETFEALLEHVDSERERLVIEAFRRYDEITSCGPEFADETAADGLRLAAALDDDGTRSYFLNVRAERSYRAGDADQADTEGGEGAAILRRIAASDPLFENQAAKATRNAMTFAMATGDFARARELAATLRGTPYTPVGDDPLAFLMERR
jgi:CHAT domain